jgi:hypothetical protein
MEENDDVEEVTSSVGALTLEPSVAFADDVKNNDVEEVEVQVVNVQGVNRTVVTATPVTMVLLTPEIERATQAPVAKIAQETETNVPFAVKVPLPLPTNHFLDPHGPNDMYCTSLRFFNKTESNPNYRCGVLGMYYLAPNGQLLGQTLHQLFAESWQAGTQMFNANSTYDLKENVIGRKARYFEWKEGARRVDAEPIKPNEHFKEGYGKLLATVLRTVPQALAPQSIFVLVKVEPWVLENEVFQRHGFWARTS